MGVARVGSFTDGERRGNEIWALFSSKDFFKLLIFHRIKSFIHITFLLHRTSFNQNFKLQCKLNTVIGDGPRRTGCLAPAPAKATA